MREYIKRITEIFDELAVVAEAVTEENKVVYLLAGLPESYDVLVTTLESETDTVPALESMTECSQIATVLFICSGRGVAYPFGCPVARMHVLVNCWLL